MSEDNFQDVSQKMKGPPAVVLGDEGLPRLYEESEISMNQLPKQHGNTWVSFLSSICILSLIFHFLTSLFFDNRVVSLTWKLKLGFFCCYI